MASVKKDKTSSQPPKTPQLFPVVGIGASAGGLDAFKRLLETIPENSGMAYVLVQHLHPSHESMLPDILQRITKIPVNEITDDIHLAPNFIYTIPSAKILTATDGVLCLQPRVNFKTNLIIDIFFKSLAEVHKELAVGVVLSGTGNDGTIGLKAIKEHGGITIAQDEKSAAYIDMPQHAIDAGVVDFILSPEDIPAQLLHINGNYPKTKEKRKEEPLPKDDLTIFKQILLLLHQRSGVDFTYYKQNTISRRIERRIGMRKKENLPGYLKFLRSNKAEQDALFQDMLIPVTSFFRDPKTFDTLCNNIFPLLFKNRTADEPVRIWIAGCSTGEEVYSLAICLHEFLGEKRITIPIQIFASDISEMAIKKARIGIYAKADIQMVSEERLKNYFRKTDGNYEVNKILRDMCVFAPHNFLKDPPFAKMDLISCRNVLIYMDNFLQKKALATFHYSLKQNGFLLLGKSETASAANELFTIHQKQDKIFSRNHVPGRFLHVVSERREEAFSKQTKTKHLPETLVTDYRKSGEAMLLNKYTPVAVIVNEQLEIVHIHGSITPFLEPSPGKPNFNLLKMAKEGLGFELRNALHKAKTTNKPVIKKDIPTKPNGKQHLVSIEVAPLTNTAEPHYLILFSKTDLPLHIVSGEKTLTSANSKQNEEAKLRILQLEKELSQAREDMRSISEEQEAANEELQSANEELQSSNEEMQSLNEELETSKEELQSSNEELIIVNHELLDKHEQLNDARLYSDSIITTIRHPLIVLDTDLRIKTANTSFYKKFNTTEEETEGKLFYEIQNNQWDDKEMRSLLGKILQQKEQLSDFEIKLTFTALGERTMLLNGRQIVNESTAQKLILLGIEDITEQVNALKKVEESERKLQNLFRDAPVSILVCRGENFIIETVNISVLEVWGKTEEQVLNRPLFEISPEIKEQMEPIYNKIYETGDPFIGREYLSNYLRNGKPHLGYYNFMLQAIRNQQNEITGIFYLGTDVTESVLSRKKIEESTKQFQTLANTIPQLAWMMNPDGGIYWFNKKWYDYTGATPEQMEGWGWQAVIHPDAVESVTEKFKKAIASGEEWEDTFLLRSHTNEYRWFLSRANAIKNESGEIVKWFGTNTDVTEQKMKEQEKDDFISIASHELKTPLTTAKGYVELLQITLNEDDQSSLLYSTKAGLAIDKLQNLVAELLDVSKIQNGKLNYNIVNFDFNDLIDVTIENVQLTTKSHQLIKTGNIHHKVNGDKDRLQQVMINLLINAIKYSPDANKVLINLVEKEDLIQVSIQDFGIGIRKQHLDKIFERYYRVEEHAISFQGLGIGLYISNNIIQRHKGKMWVDTVIDKGSTFYYTLPL